MNKYTKLVLLGVLSVLLCACDIPSLFEQPSEDQPRTYYETLDLSTPQSAIRTFSEAFQREDFMSVYLVLAPQAQFVIHQRINLLQYDYLFQPERREKVLADVSVFSEGLGQGEHIDSGWYLFDQIMLSAKKHSALLVDLSGKVTVIDTTTSETYGGDEAVDVTATVEGIEDEVVFRMVQAPSGRWRVYQVILAGGDEEMVPWAMPKESEPVRIEASADIQVPCSGDPPPPSRVTPGQPYLIAEPTCGDLSTQDDNYNTVPGTTLTLTGGGFEPNTETEIWWEDPLGNSFRIRQEGEYLTVTTDDEGGFLIDVVMPYRLIPPSAAGKPQLHRVLAVQEIPADGP